MAIFSESQCRTIFGWYFFNQSKAALNFLGFKFFFKNEVIFETTPFLVEEVMQNRIKKIMCHVDAVHTIRFSAQALRSAPSIMIFSMLNVS